MCIVMLLLLLLISSFLAARPRRKARGRGEGGEGGEEGDVGAEQGGEGGGTDRLGVSASRRCCAWRRGAPSLHCHRLDRFRFEVPVVGGAATPQRAVVLAGLYGHRGHTHALAVVLEAGGGLGSLISPDL